MSTASYVHRYSVLANSQLAYGMSFNNDGTKMYIVNPYGTSDDIDEYILSTAFDVSSASYSQRLLVANREASPTGMSFNNDGTKMFIVGSVGREVNEYALSTAFDVSTATYTTVFSVSSEDTNPQGITFNNDGTKMYVVGNTGDDINEYSLATAFDVSTASYVQNFSVLDGTPTGMAFNNDGTKMYIIGTMGNMVYEYNLDNPTSPTVCVNDAITNFTFQYYRCAQLLASNVITVSGTPTA